MATVTSRELTEAASAGGAARNAFGGAGVARDPLARTPEARDTDDALPARAEVILNAAAGKGECGRAAERVGAILREGGLNVRVTLARGGAEIEAAAKRAAEDDETGVVVAGGGDGTVGAVASHLVGTRKVLGVLPFGTLNHFARDLGLPPDAEEAARAIITGRAASIDVGEVRAEAGAGARRVFLNNSSLGIYPVLVRERERLQERAGQSKWRAAARAAFTVLRRYPFVSVRLAADGREMIRRTPFVFVGNNEYELDALRVGTRARLDAGLLSLHVTRDIGRLGLVRLALRTLFGRLREDKDFDALRAREVWVETGHARLRVAADGEVTIMRPPLRYRVLPGALRVRVPREDRGVRED
jgi:diacylglycerol kinase family enzyme